MEVEIQENEIVDDIPYILSCVGKFDKSCWYIYQETALLEIELPHLNLKDAHVDVDMKRGLARFQAKISTCISRTIQPMLFDFRIELPIIRESLIDWRTLKVFMSIDYDETIIQMTMGYKSDDDGTVA